MRLPAQPPVALADHARVREIVVTGTLAQALPGRGRGIQCASPHSSGDRATASGAVCAGSNPAGGAGKDMIFEFSIENVLATGHRCDLRKRGRDHQPLPIRPRKSPRPGTPSRSARYRLTLTQAACVNLAAAVPQPTRTAYTLRRDLPDDSRSRRAELARRAT